MQALGDLDVAAHRATQQHYLTMRAIGGAQRVVDAIDLRGEAGQDDATRRLVDDIVERLNRGGLGRRASGQLRIGGVAEHREHAGIAERAEALAVDLAANVLAGRVELVVAGMDDRAELRVQRDRGGIGDRVRDADELRGDRADLDHVARLHGDERRQRQIVLRQLGLDHRDGERQRDDAADRRARADQVRQRGNVVVVGVRHEDGVDGLAAHHAHVGQEDIDAKAALIAMRKADAAIDHDANAVVLDDHHVAPDFAETANGGNANRIRHAGHGTGKRVRSRRTPGVCVGLGARFLAYSPPLGVWRSLVARSVRDGEVRSSNLRTPMSG